MRKRKLSVASKVRKTREKGKKRRAENTEAKRITRQDEERRQREQEANTESHRLARQDEERRQHEQEANTESHRLARQDEERRQREQEADAKARRLIRQDEERRQREQDANTKSHQLARQDQERRQREQEANTKSHQLARQDQERRQREQEADAKARRLIRQDEERRQREQEADAKARRLIRQDEERRQREQEANTKSHRLARQDQERRQREQEANTSAHFIARQDLMVRTPEKQRDAKARRTKTRTFRSSYDKLLDAFMKKIREAPEFICSCCGGLWYKESTTVTSAEQLTKKGCSPELIKSVLYVPQQIHRLDSTCKASVQQKRVPRMSLCNGLDFPIIPDMIKDLCPLEERLVSPRLPFMQIKVVGCDRQSALRGNIVNVENDLDICAEVLPRRFDDMSTVQVQLMRRMRYRSPYMYEIIRPKKVYEAAKVLIQSELYQEEGIVLSDAWSRAEVEDQIEFIVPPGTSDESADLDDMELDQADVAESNTGEGEEVREVDQNSFADESLFYRESDLNAHGIRIAPGEGKIPVPLFRDFNAEVLSFPTIYGGAKRNFNPDIRITYTDIAKSELRRYDRRACRPAKLLYAFKRSFNEKVYKAIQVCMRKRVGSFTAANARNPSFINNLLKNDEGYAVFKNLRSSPSYWKEQTKKVVAMIRQIGSCAFFITFSAAESKWTELVKILFKLLRNKEITEEEAAQLTFDEVAEMIRSDPVTCMRHFEHRYRALLNLLFKPDGGIFHPHKYKDHFSRMEFQMRGSPHSHGLYWVEGAPTYNEDSEESSRECSEFIDTFITCERSEDEEMDQVIGYQLHKHSQTCHKNRQNKKCRFGFPIPPMESTIILKPLPKEFGQCDRKRASDSFTRIQNYLNEKGRAFKDHVDYDDFLESLEMTHMEYILAVRSSLKRPKVFLKRGVNASFINAYNRKLLLAWRANMDIQFVLDTYACAKYCVGYIMKADGGVSKLLQAATEEARRGNTEIRDKLKKYANILINGSEISAQEAAAFLLGIPNTSCSRQDIFINTAHPDDRIGFLKSREELDELPDDSQEVCTKGLIDHYIQRPEEMEDCCLADFGSLYEFTKNIPKKFFESLDEECNFESRDDRGQGQPAKKGVSNVFLLQDHSGVVRKRTIRKILRFRHYSKAQDPVNFWREQLMLFVPWRHEENDLLNIDHLAKAQEEMETIKENCKNYYADPEVDDRLLNTYVAEVDTDSEQPDGEIDDDDDGAEAESYFQDNFVEELGPTRSRAEKFLIPRLIVEEDYLKVMRTLNEKQRRFVLNTLHLAKTASSPFYSFLSGGAGVGKSHCITAIVQSLLRFHAKAANMNPEEICVLVSAPTGKAAFNVFGMTLHGTFKLPPNQYGGRVGDLDPGVLNTLRLRLSKVKLFIIDEISMVSVKQLYDIDQRLRQIYGTHEDFGGRSLLVVGHLRQLPPIGGAYVFTSPRHLPLGECVGNHLWEKFSLYELDQIMRQEGEFEFCKALNNMAEGTMDDEDIALIKSRMVTPTNVPPPNSIYLFATNKECAYHNSKVHKRLEDLGTEGATSVAFDKVQGVKGERDKENLLNFAKQLTPQQSDGLPYETHLQVGGEYFISTNIDVQDGLFNGSTGTLKMIEYGTTHSGFRIPVRAWMDFQHPLVGASRRAVTKAYQLKHHIPLHWVAIDRITRNLNKNRRLKGELVRTQIPLVGANGMTIPKAQGSSLMNVVLSVKESEFRRRKLSRESIYVGCSRATSQPGLFLDGEFEPPAAPGPNDPVTLEMARLRSIPFQFSIKFLQDYDDSFEKIFFQNVQSFLLHQQDIMADHCAMASNYLAMVEPHLLEVDNLILPNHSVVHRSNCSGSQRNSEGVLLLRKTILREQFCTATLSRVNSPAGHCLFLKYTISGITLTIMYKHPSYSDSAFLVLLREALTETNGKGIFVGDININLQKPEGKRAINLFQSFNFQSKLDVTQASPDGGSHIDCCFSNAEEVHAWFYESYYSYHKPICIVWPK